MNKKIPNFHFDFIIGKTLVHRAVGETGDSDFYNGRNDT